MMNVAENASLKAYNTFGIDVSARYFTSFENADSLADLLDFTSESPMILGGGSNILFTGNVDCLVLHNKISGMKKIAEDDGYVYLQAGAGESWHGFVQYCIQNNLAGVENLSLIPGSVGAAPMQNIGAYGVEIKEVFHSLEAWDVEDHTIHTFSLTDCEFGYRESIFKRRFKGRFIILNVTFRLSKQPKFHTEYGAIREELEKMNITELSIQAISQAVIRIRQSKLPDPARIGNAGSFFKNPTIPAEQFLDLKQKFPNIIGYPNPVTAPNATAAPNAAGTPNTAAAPNASGTPNASADPGIKLAAGWLIEQCGWKGYRKGDAGCHEKQALVLVNYGHATGKEIFDLSEQILQTVKEKFNVTLEREVNII